MENINGMRHIFISSTFRDMQAERDLVQEHILPELRIKSSRYGENVEFTDLRWGVDTTEISPEEGAKKVLRVCFDEIDKCDPYMLVFVGARYGWIPSEDTVKQALSQREGLFDNTDLQQSVTSLEIEYGTLASRRTNADKSVVCFRVDDVLSRIPDSHKAIYEEIGDLAKEKLAGLKEKLTNKYGDNIIFYSATWDGEAQKFKDFVTLEGKPLAEAITERFEKIFSPAWEEYAALCVEERELRRAKAIQDKYISSFVGQEEEVRALAARIEDSIGNCHAVLYKSPVKLDEEENDSENPYEKGNSLMEGFGISATMSVLSDVYRKKGYNSVVFYCGRTPETTGISDLLEDIYYYLIKVIGHKPEREKESFIFEKEYFEYLIKEATEKGKVFIFIDRLYDIAINSELKNLLFLPEATENFKLILTGDVWAEVDNLHRTNYAEVELFDISEDTVSKIVGSNYKAVQKAILEKKSAKLPLYLNLVNLRLKMLGFEELHDSVSEEEIIAEAVKAVSEMQDDPYAASYDLLMLATAKLDLNEKEIMTALEALAISECGLRLQDLAALLKKMDCSFNSLDFITLRKYMSEILTEDSDGFIKFDRVLVQDQIKKRFSGNYEAMKPYYDAYRDYMYELPETDLLFRKMGYLSAWYTADYELGVRVLSAAGKNDDKTIASVIRFWLLFEKAQFFNNLMKAMLAFGKYTADSYALDFLADFIASFNYSEIDEYLVGMFFERLSWVMKSYEWAYAVSKGESDYELYKNNGATQEKLDEILKGEEEMRQKLKNITLPENAREAYVRFYQNMAVRRKNQNRNEEAEDYANKANVTVFLEGKTDNSIKNKLDEVRSLYVHADSLRENGKNEEALRYCSLAGDIVSGIMQENSGDLTHEEVTRLNSLECNLFYERIRIYFEIKEYEAVFKCYEYFKKVWDTLEGIDAQRSIIRTVWADVNLYMYEALMAADRTDEALEYLNICIAEETVLFRYGTAVTGTGVNLAYAYTKAGDYYGLKGDNAKKAEYYDKAVKMYVPMYKDRNDKISLLDLLNSADKLAMTYVDLGDYDQAIVALYKATGYYVDYIYLLKEQAKGANEELPKSEINSAYQRAFMLLKLGGGICKQQEYYDKQIIYLDTLFSVSCDYMADTGDRSIVPLVDNYIVKITNVNVARRKYEDNIKYFKKLLEFRGKIYAETASEESLQNIAEAQNGLGNTYSQMGDKAMQVVSLAREHGIACDLCQKFGLNKYLNNVVAVIKDIGGITNALYDEVVAGKGNPVTLAQCLCLEIQVVNDTKKLSEISGLDGYLKNKIGLFKSLINSLKAAGYDNLQEEEAIVNSISERIGQT